MSYKKKQKNNSRGKPKINLILGSRKIFLLGAFCILSACTVFFVAKASFTGMYKIPFSVNMIKKPGYIDQTNLDRPVAISHQQDHKIKEFKKYMDSLEHSPSGKIFFDSIITARPGLLDSIFILEQFYHLQKNNQYHGTAFP